MLNTCFPFGSLEFRYLAGGRCLRDQPPNLGWHLSPYWASLVDIISHVLEELAPPVWGHWYRNFWNLYLVSPRLHPLCLFPLPSLLFTLTIANHSHDCNHMPSPVSPSKSSKSEVFLGTWTHPYITSPNLHNFPVGEVGIIIRTSYIENLRITELKWPGKQTYNDKGKTWTQIFCWTQSFSFQVCCLYVFWGKGNRNSHTECSQ